MVKKINPLIQPDRDGVYINGKYFGPANGYFENGLPAGLNGCYEGGVFKNGIYVNGRWVENATGLYENNVKQVFENGVYIGGERQTNRFQDVLEELRLEHDPEHWASWALDGSLEEDRGQFPIVHQSPRLEWVPVGGRLGLSGTLNNAELGFQCGTNSDFNYVHNEREFTIGLWANTKNLPTTADILGTNMSSQLSRGFTFFKVEPRGAYYIYLYGDSLWQANATTGVFDHFEFVVIRNFPSLANSYNLFAAAQPILSSNMTPSGDFGDSFGPMGFLRGRTGIVPPIILNAFATNHVLTDAEIYKLYQAGLNDIQTF